MTLSEFSDTYSWTQAADLGPHLLSLADELPANESTSIGVLLRQLAVEIPAGIAANLITDSKADLTNILKLMTALELIERVYPVIEVTDTRKLAGELAERLAGDNFTEIPKPEEPAALPSGLEDDDDEDDDKDGEPAPAPEDVAITPEAEAEAEKAEPKPVTPTAPIAPAAPITPITPVTPTQVHPAESIQPIHPSPSAPSAPAANPFSISIKPATEESHVHPDSEQ